MSLSKEDVKYIAKLAKLEFSESELDGFVHQFNQILEYMDTLNGLDTSGVEPLAYPVEYLNVFRDDVPSDSLSPGEALKNAPDCTEEFFKVPKVIKQN